MRVDGDQLTADIRNWRDQTRGLLGPDAPARPVGPLAPLANASRSRARWRDVDHLLTELDAERENAKRLANLYPAAEEALRVPKLAVPPAVCGARSIPVLYHDGDTAYCGYCDLKPDHDRDGIAHGADIRVDGTLVARLSWG